MTVHAKITFFEQKMLKFHVTQIWLEENRYVHLYRKLSL
ncbi:hypothetical protein CCAND95_10139 [Capnocytophaga canis]|nr:hypothetical protein CCAND95_10139 [Capnocytophaga canis]